MYPILLPASDAKDYGYDITTIFYLAHLLLRDGEAIISWREGIAIPDEDDDGVLTEFWRVQLFLNGEVEFISSRLTLADALRIVQDWTYSPYAPETKSPEEMMAE